jgi:hypothetical protein
VSNVVGVSQELVSCSSSGLGEPLVTRACRGRRVRLAKIFVRRSASFAFLRIPVRVSGARPRLISFESYDEAANEALVS